MKFRSINEQKDYQWRFVLNAIHEQGQSAPKYRCPNGHLNYTPDCETCKARGNHKDANGSVFGTPLAPVSK
jgi:hypothetical protein